MAVAFKQIKKPLHTIRQEYAVSQTAPSSGFGRGANLLDVNFEFFVLRRTLLRVFNLTLLKLFSFHPHMTTVNDWERYRGLVEAVKDLNRNDLRTLVDKKYGGFRNVKKKLEIYGRVGERSECDPREC